MPNLRVSEGMMATQKERKTISLEENLPILYGDSLISLEKQLGISY
jgi:hypothetical protein